MIPHRYKILLVTNQALMILCMICGIVNAQTINYGKVVIKEGTTVSTLFALENKPEATLVNDGTLYVYSHFKNDGIFNFTQGGYAGMTRFVGQTGIQKITGSQIAELNDVVFDNASDPYAFQLEGTLSVTGNGDFSRGIVQSDGYGGLIIFEKGASHSNTSDISHMDGFVQKIGDESFIYPVGDGGFYRHDGISAPSNDQYSIETNYFFEDPDPSYPRAQKEAKIQVIDDSEYWVLNKVEGGDEDVDVILSWRDVTTPAFILGEEKSRLHIAKWDEENEQWIDMGGEVDLANYTVTAPAKLAATGVYTFALVQEGATDLQVTKTSFEKVVWEGDDLEYEIRVQNNSDINATDVMVVDNLPPGTRYKEMVVESAFGLLEYELEVSGQTLMWSVPAFLAGDEMVITLTITTEGEGTIMNSVKVNSNEEDTNPENNEDQDINKVNKFFIPNVITPNGDMDNDVFKINGLNRFKENRITIFNRFGDHVFEAEDYQNDWAAKGLVDGTYFYMLEVMLENGQKDEFKGWIQVIRTPIK
ncbi:T9SS type B sorting domain-containing protein [Echinicola soli]|uniref:T9SS type B sorting domain-containing protein n=1 Tax=Echinicola soli TaxID=2591634 RepID=A0A514CG04_9BACT|nr:gliding motility-associated C-terminal domain-containing protein [Echinicola soli]QDH78751.1 T9SS type B sorting domain-containing protein [Echinicola soli]